MCFNSRTMLRVLLSQNQCQYQYQHSPGYAGVSLSLVMAELNAHGLNRTDSLRLNPGDPNYFVHISSSWVEISFYTEFQLPRLLLVLGLTLLEAEGGGEVTSICVFIFLLVVLK